MTTGGTGGTEGMDGGPDDPGVPGDAGAEQPAGTDVPAGAPPTGRRGAHRRARRRVGRRLVLGALALVALLVALVVVLLLVRSTGPSVYTVDVRPGYTVSEVVRAVSVVPGRTGNHFAATVRSGAVRSTYGTPSSTSLEGLLGTGNYQVVEGESDQRLLTAMVDRFEHQAAAAGLTPQSAAALGLSPYQVVIVASIAEKEGYFDRYMGKVSRVVYNRLAAGMSLDMTATVLYALGQDGGPVPATYRTIDSPYNTYTHAGLTPTPICMPSPTAIAGAVSPPAGTWLYFTVVDKSGTTKFSDTYTEQLANEQLAKQNGVG